MKIALAVLTFVVTLCIGCNKAPECAALSQDEIEVHKLTDWRHADWSAICQRCPGKVLTLSPKARFYCSERKP